MTNIKNLTTEQQNPLTIDLDTFTPVRIARVMNSEDKHAVEAVEQQIPQIAQAIEWAGQALQDGGRIIYIGAGTSGRLGVLDAVECPPTFGVNDNTVLGLIAGGEHAFIKAAEGVEDDCQAGARDLQEHKLTKKDLVVGIAASGRTPYVIGALRFANETGCKTVAIACNRASEIGCCADLAIEPLTGPEVLSGSTRLKAGTAQKLILNMISTGAMTCIGKVYKNLMVDVQQTNEKLHSRAQNIVREACSCSSAEAQTALEAAGGQVKTAITMLLLNCSADKALDILSECKGHVREAISKSMQADA